MFDKSVEFKGLPILNMHFSDEESTIIEDDMTVDQKVQTVDFWTGRTIFKYGDSAGNSDQFALPSKNRPGPHRDKREAKNEKKAQRFESTESVSDHKGGCMTKPVNLVRYDMSSFLESCVDAYCELAKVKKDQLPNVATRSRKLESPVQLWMTKRLQDSRTSPANSLQGAHEDFVRCSYGPARSLEGNPKSSLSCNQVVSRV